MEKVAKRHRGNHGQRSHYSWILDDLATKPEPLGIEDERRLYSAGYRLGIGRLTADDDLKLRRLLNRQLDHAGSAARWREIYSEQRVKYPRFFEHGSGKR